MEHMIVYCKSLSNGKKEFLSSLEKELEPFIQSAKEQNNFDWVHLKRLYNNRKNELTVLCNLRIFCDFGFDVFFKFSCEDNDLMVKIVRIYQQVVDEYTRLDLCGFCIMQDRLPKHYLNENMINTRPLLKRVNSLKLDSCSFTNSDYYGQLTSDAIFDGDYDFVRFSVKYGLSSISPEDILYQLKAQLETIFGNYVAQNPQAGADILENREVFADSILKRVLGTSSFDKFESSQLSTLIRSSITMLAVTFSISRRERGKNYAMNTKCYDLYISTLSEPAISMKDVNDFLDIVFENDEAYKVDTISYFREVFPKIPSLPTPRPLKYLCRCKVRSHIKKDPSLTVVLSEIEIPSTLKDYLLYMSD